MAPVTDPFLWEVDQVVDALCAVGKPWVQDGSFLESKIREEEIDGETLLTYEIMFSRKEFMDLLGIKGARRQRLLLRELVSLRNHKRSPAYDAWLTAYKKDLSRDSDESSEANNLTEPVEDPAEKQKADPTRFTSDKLQANAPGTPNGNDHGAHMSRSGTLSQTSQTNGTKGAGAEAPSIPSNSELVKQAPPIVSSEQPASAEPPRKRRRIPATLVSKSVSSKFPWEHQPKGAYIGAGSIGEFDVINPSKQLSSWIAGDSSDEEFAYLPRNRLPPGLRVSVNRMAQRLLRRGAGSAAERQTALQEPLTIDDRVSLGITLQPEDDNQTVISSAIPSDEEDEIDRQIAAEQEDERREMEAYMKRHALLAKDQVRALINDEVARVISQWKERKIPKLQRKAYSIWSASRRRDTKIRDVVDARKKAQFFDGRLQRMITEILDLDHEAEKKVRRSAESLEPTVEDKLYYTWVANTLESNVEPPRPETVPRPKKTVQKVTKDDPELITSSEEEEDFVATDDEDSAEAPVDHQNLVNDDVDMVETLQDTPSGELEATRTNGAGTQEQTPNADDEMPDIIEQFAEADERAQALQTTPAPQEASAPRAAPTTLAHETLVKQEGQHAVDSSHQAQPQKNSTPEVIDLTSPTKPDSAIQKKRRELLEDIADQAPSLDTLAAESFDVIKKAGPRHWSKNGDRYKLVISMLAGLNFESRSEVYDTIKANAPDVTWQLTVMTFLGNPPEKVEGLQQGQQMTGFEITRIFLSYLRCRNIPPNKLAPASSRTMDKLRENKSHFAMFSRFIINSEPLFPHERQIYRPDLSDSEFEDDYLHAAGADNDDIGEAGSSQRSQGKGRKGKPKEIVRDKDAVDLRLQEQQRIKDQEARRTKLRESLAMSGAVSQDKSRLIINESKDDEQSLLYVNEEIGKSIKEHQIEGIRFFWNQIITDQTIRQGCLLSHTMGLGKTMQVITFLVAIAEAAKSSDPSLRHQIPKDLRESQTLILCPPGLVNNWMDELLKWAPKDSLGDLFQVDSQADPFERLNIIDLWASEGGVLVMGYMLFQKITSVAPDDAQAIGAGRQKAVRVSELLLEKPNIVIADEAHWMKNLKGNLNQACHRLRTSTRLALTGSPLANHVKEYYAMIDWVAPNFLGPLQEFHQIYVQDIERGLARDSDGFEKRKASKMLQVLKETVDPKVHRATTKTPSLARDLPQKAEYMISVPPTPLQEELYCLFIDAMHSKERNVAMSLIWDLALICAHPRCFRQKLLAVKKALNTPGNSEYPSFPHEIIEKALSLASTSGFSEPSHSNKIQYLIAILDEARAMGDKVLVFSHSLETLDFLERLLVEVQARRVCRLDGTSNVSGRQESVKKFNTGSKEIYLISTKAGGVGLNIHGANRVVLFDTSWNPVHEQQAVGRAYRLGQKKPVFVYHLKVAGSFEETLQDQAIFKTQLAQRVVDKKNPVAWGKRNGQYDGHLKVVKSADLTPFENKDDILDRLIRDPPGGSRITKILLTDTLEEEDPTSALTKEERAEATARVRLNELRRTNPAEYEKQKEELDRREAASIKPASLPQQVSSGTPSSNTVAPPSQRSKPVSSIPGLSYNELAQTLPATPDDSTDGAPVPHTSSNPPQPLESGVPKPFEGRSPQHLTSDNPLDKGEAQTTDAGRPSSDETAHRV